VSQGSLFDGERDELVVYFDGGSRGNPGEAAIGAVVRDAGRDAPLVTISERIGVATNNVAEYRALIAGLEAASRHGGRRLLVRGDSQLVLKQLRGEYKVKHPALKPLYDEARKLLRRFDDVTLEHVPRDQNVDADALVNAALDA
jgi:ribonuclease HI